MYAFIFRVLSFGLKALLILAAVAIVLAAVYALFRGLAWLFHKFSSQVASDIGSFFDWLGDKMVSIFKRKKGTKNES